MQQWWATPILYLSLEPSGRMNLGTSTNNLHPIRTVSQTKFTASHTLTFTDRRQPSIPASRDFTTGFSSGFRHPSKLINLTGGSVMSPTPLPSVLWADTCTAWDTSGAMPRPCTQLYTKLWHRHQPKQHHKSASASDSVNISLSTTEHYLPSVHEQYQSRLLCMQNHLIQVAYSSNVAL